jgi:hypothetical protein
MTDCLIDLLVGVQRLLVLQKASSGKNDEPDDEEFDDDELGRLWGEVMVLLSLEKLIPLDDIDEARMEYSESLICVTVSAWPPMRLGMKMV